MRSVLDLLEGSIIGALVVFACALTVAIGGATVHPAAFLLAATGTGALARFTFSKTTRR